MPVTPVKLSLKWRSFYFLVLALVVCGTSAWAQVPAIVFDAQQVVGNQYSGPQSIAVSTNGTVFIADTGNNRIIALDTFLPKIGVNNVVSTAPFVLSAPTALALDAHGNLYVGDAPSTGGRIIELYGDGNGNLTGVVNPNPIVSGPPLVNPGSLTFDSAGTLFIGDLSANGTIYSLAAGSSALQLLTFTGAFPTEFFPGALVTDSSHNLYIADTGGATPGGIYKAPDTGGPAVKIPTPQFSLFEPAGLAFNAKGDLYVLTQLGNGTGPNPGYQVLIIPANSPETPYILPNNGLNISSGIAFDNNGNLDIADFGLGQVVQLSSPNPVNLGNVLPTQPVSQVQFNFEFNARVNLRGFRTLTAGDVSTEITQAAGGTCLLGVHDTGNGGQAISNYYPYNCEEHFFGTPTYPGVRAGAIQVRGAGATILASVPVWQTGFFGAEVTYPLNESVTATNLQEPQALAISGLNKTVYVADALAGAVVSYKGLTGKNPTTINTGTIPFPQPFTPIALALDGAGDLFIADYNNAQVIEVPPANTGQVPSVVNTGDLLQHPLSLAFDYLGNLYIGDGGTEGFLASSASPGYLVKIPVGGTAFKMPIPTGLSVILPQALATDPSTADLLIGDAGDPSSVGFVTKIFANGSGGGTAPVNGVTNPSGLVFDQAETLYILDGTANTITAVPGPEASTPPFLVQFNNADLLAPSALAASAGAQSFVIANIGSETNNLVYLNGNRSTLNFGGVTVGTPSAPQTATVYNIGNLDLTLKKPYYSTNGVNAAFSVLPSSTCTDDLLLARVSSCTINVQFTPQSLGSTRQQLAVESDGYNGTTGNPVLTLEGSGDGVAIHHDKGGKR
jgi:sugar lactone lactonase YvrE